MKNLSKIALGILTSIGGYLEVGSLGTAIEAGAMYRYSLLWAIVLGTVCIAFLTEMTGRLAAVSQHTVVAAVRKRFGIRFQIWPLLAQIVVDLFVLASELGGASLALELSTGISIRVWVIPIALLIWALLWFATFGVIEHSVSILGLITLSFTAAAWWRGPDWHALRRGIVPQRSSADPLRYTYLAVGVLGATISPYLFTFYSSGAVEERWTVKDLAPNRVVAALGMGFGSLVAVSAMIMAAIVLAPRGIIGETYQLAATMLSLSFGRWGFWLFGVSLAIGCIGAALEIALDVNLSQGDTPNGAKLDSIAEEMTFVAGVKLEPHEIVSLLGSGGMGEVYLGTDTRLKRQIAIKILAQLVSVHGAPQHLRSDNGPEFVATAILRWLQTAQIETAFIDPGKPWQNGTDESFNGKLRHEYLSLKWFAIASKPRSASSSGAATTPRPSPFESRVFDTAGIQSDLCAHVHGGALAGSADSR